MNIPFVKYSKIWVGLSASFVVISIILLFTLGLKPGIDFTGGSLMELSFDVRPEVTEMKSSLTDLKIENPVVQKTGDDGMIIRMRFLNEDEHQEVLGGLRDDFGSEENRVHEERFEAIGAAISSQLRKRSMWAAIFVCLAIVLYVAYAFRRVSKPIASWKYGMLAIVALGHDVLIVMGIFSLLGHFAGVEINIAFVVALLTIMGYSVNDTIVVFDRIRENLIKRVSPNFGETINIGLNQTLMRSLNTSITTILVLLALYLFGGTTTNNFVLALMVGVISGAYSSIFLASPLLVLIERRNR
jgi:preprotein translocase subunit SecF